MQGRTTGRQPPHHRVAAGVDDRDLGRLLAGHENEAVDAGGLGREGKQGQEEQQELRHQTTDSK